jgi:hypothetical protein
MIYPHPPRRADTTQGCKFDLRIMVCDSQPGRDRCQVGDSRTKAAPTPSKQKSFASFFKKEALA